jgi:hypothetical protein
MTLRVLAWKPGSPILTPQRGVRGTQYLLDDETQEIVAQEVVDYDENLRQVISQVTLSLSDAPADVQQSARSLQRLNSLNRWSTNDETSPSEPAGRALGGQGRS